MRGELPEPMSGHGGTILYISVLLQLFKLNVVYSVLLTVGIVCVLHFFCVPVRAWKKKRETVKSLIHVRLFETPQTVVHQAPFCPWNSPAKILEWVAVPFSRGSSWPRDQTWVFHNAGIFFTIQATREDPSQYLVHSKFPANSPRMSMSFLCQYFLGCPSTGWLAPQV